MNAGAFQAELVAVSVTSRGHVTNVTADESPRADCDLARLSMLRPAFASVGSVTAGNASTISDGASAVVVASDEVAERLGRKPLANRRIGNGRRSARGSFYRSGRGDSSSA